MAGNTTSTLSRWIEDIPQFLLPVRSIAADFAGIVPDQLQQPLITHYAPGAPIGWHRDKTSSGGLSGFSFVGLHIQA